jgi:hypothetical protein
MVTPEVIGSRVDGIVVAGGADVAQARIGIRAVDCRGSDYTDIPKVKVLWNCGGY